MTLAAETTAFAGLSWPAFRRVFFLWILKSRLSLFLDLPRGRCYLSEMTLHLVKLCVGCDTLDELANWQRQRLAEVGELTHVTRQTPRRPGFAAGSSLYWVIGGFIRARQAIVAIREARGTDGVQRCCLVFSPALIPTEPQPRRPFQGWRYLPEAEAPRDLERHRDRSRAETAIPPQMRAALLELRLI